MQEVMELYDRLDSSEQVGLDRHLILPLIEGRCMVGPLHDLIRSDDRVIIGPESGLCQVKRLIHYY